MTPEQKEKLNTGAKETVNRIRFVANLISAHLWNDMRENYDIFCSMVVYPVVPKGVIILRLIPTAVHTIKDVEYTIDAFNKAYVKLKAGEYMSDKIAAF